MKLLEFSRQFSTEEDCERYLKEQREKHGMVCPRCGCKKMYWDRCHKLGVEKTVAHSLKRVVPGKDAPKLLPWVHIAISNAKSLFADMYHGIKDEFLQEYLNEFCYKFNRMFFGERLFDRLVLASISYRPEFEHRIYNHSNNRG